MLVDSLRGDGESLYKAVERANDMFLAPEELRRKQNAEAMRRLRGLSSPPRQGRVTKLG